MTLYEGKFNRSFRSCCSWTYIISAVRIFSHTNLSVLKVSVDILRFVEKIEHLPNGKFKVHLSEVEYPPQVLKSISMSLSLWITDYWSPCIALLPPTCSWICRRPVLGVVTWLWRSLSSAESWAVRLLRLRCREKGNGTRQATLCLPGHFFRFLIYKTWNNDEITITASTHVLSMSP